MRRVRKKGGNKEKVFGCDLLEHLAATNQESKSKSHCWMFEGGLNVAVVVDFCLGKAVYGVGEKDLLKVILTQ